LGVAKGWLRDDHAVRLTTLKLVVTWRNNDNPF
jgi:hypothetical protein